MDYPGQKNVHRAVVHRMINGERSDVPPQILNIVPFIDDVIPLVLDFYPIIFRSGCWEVYEEAMLRMWKFFIDTVVKIIIKLPLIKDAHIVLNIFVMVLKDISEYVEYEI
ncbi:hypothetical protein RhiirC2_715479 [Rhizophagus irregularis]|uniref:Uncharacterized protein n=1 Tax=Rhizophagus irregularis TaxID=588596 RepID=A0A2N1MV86_9GLOM|nr:hypothetical protein RhiirC2_715479 [Rhizophagus irregularis]